jgi:photosystem II stability/assembly factor-like uncharacterized protein
MPRRSWMLLTIAALVATTGGAQTVTATGSAGGDPSRQPIQRIRHEPGDAMITQRLAGDSVIESRSHERAVEQAGRLAADGADLREGLAALGRSERAGWRFEGPTNRGGRLKDIVVAPDGTLWVAAASGGVWRSDDGGATFERSWPEGNSQAIETLARGSDGTLWAGTGETGPGGGSTTFAGSGVYRSDDDGRTWKRSGLRDSHRISELVVHPRNPDLLYAAVSGDLFRPGGVRGLYRSTNGGRSWRRILQGATPTAGAVDLALDTTNPDRLYVTFWDHLRQPDLRTYGGPGSRAYRSSDGGDTWTQMTAGLPAPGPDTGRMAITVAPSDPNRLYLIHVHRLGRFDGLFTSADMGASWTRLPDDDELLTGSQSTYGWWFGQIWVSPDDANDVWIPGVPLIRSRDGGQTWGPGVGEDVHVDHHALVFDPDREGTIYLGNDGGFYRTDDDGATWTKARVEPFTQYYTIDVGEQDPSRIVGGSQDNGCHRSWGAPEGFNDFACGDGLETLINPQNQNLVYACSQYGNCGRSEDGGDTVRSFRTTADRRGWKSPIEFDPNNPSIMYFGGNLLNKSTDTGLTWTAISPDLTNGPGRDTQYPFGTITTIGVAKTDPNRVYIGADDSTIAVTRDGGQTWTKLSGLPNRWITRLRVDPRNADVVYATLSGFRQGESAAHVFRTDDGGATWRDISGRLPNAPVNDLVQVGRALYVANDVGVFASPSGGNRWVPVSGLPNVPVMELRVHAPSERLYAGTFGRGFYSTPIPVP